MPKGNSTKYSEKALTAKPGSSPRKLSAHDIALGIGRKATAKELEEYLSRPYGKSTPLRKGVKEIKRKLKKKMFKAVNIKQYNAQLDDAEKRIANGKFTLQEDLEKKLKSGEERPADYLRPGIE
jgi:hypothetical protein